MLNQINHLNNEVTDFLDVLNHSFRQEIEALRHCILSANSNLTENIKWNGPNYCFDNEDRITMRIQPLSTKQIQVIFHCGAKVKVQPKEKLLQENVELLVWKSNDRAVATFKTMLEITENEANLSEIVKKWIAITS